MTSSDRDARDRAMWAGLAAWEATGEVMPDVVKARAERLRLEDYMDAVTRAARASIDGATDVEPVFLRDVPDEPAPTPDVGGLLYERRINSVYGSHTAGKTWFALWCATQVQKLTLYVDYEDSAAGFRARAKALDQGLLDKVLFMRPAPVEVILGVVEQYGVGLVVIDTVGEAMAAMGLDTNAEKDTTRWFAEVPDRIAEAGPAVLLLDHVAKRADGKPSPVGSFRKSAAITGASFALENVVGFAKDKAGTSILRCTKDRNGTFATDEKVATVDFEPDGTGHTEVTVTLGAGADPRRTDWDALTRAIVKFVEAENAKQGQTGDNGDPLEWRPNKTYISQQVTGFRQKDIAERVITMADEGLLAFDEVRSGNGRNVPLYRVPTPADDFDGTD